MAESSKALREKRAPLVLQAQELNDKIQAEARDFSAEEQQVWDKIGADINLLTRQIKHAEDAEGFISAASDPGTSEEARQQVGRQNVSHKPGDEIPGDTEARDKPQDSDVLMALQGWMRHQLARVSETDLPLEARHLNALKRLGKSQSAEFFTIQLRSDYQNVRRECRVQTGVSDTAGGFLRPDEFVRNLERALLAYGGVRSVADVMRTSGGADMPWPTVNDTSNKGRRIGEANPTTATETDVAVGQTVLRAHLYSSDLIRVSESLLQDSAFPLGTVIPEILGERIGRITSEEYTTGSGGSMPYGIVTQSTLGVTTAAATAITFDEVFDLIHSVDPSYRTSAGFMLHDNIILYVRKLKDGNGNYLWQPSNQMGVPDRLAGYPITVNQDMQSSVATGTRTMLFGDFSKYKIRDVANIRFRVLTERYGELDQTGFVAFFRTDGALLNAGGNPVKHMLQV